MEISFVDGAENGGGSPSKQYADAMWRMWPRLSPDWWRESLAVTVGKVWLDARTGDDSACHAWGVNGVYGAEAVALPGRIMVTEVTGAPERWLAQGAESVVWRAAVPELAGLLVLERWVMEGVIGHYGLAGVRPEDMPQWLTLAEQAADEVWGRKKRPGLRCLVLRANVVELAAFVEPVVPETRHGVTEVLPLAELAARRGWRMIVEGALHWQVQGAGEIVVDDAVPEEETLGRAIGLLERLAGAEDMLAESLGGWPALEGRPVWRAGALLGNGQPLWPGREALLRWQTDVWPAMRAGMAVEAGDEGVWQAYEQAMERFLADGAHTMALLAEKRLVAAVLDDLRGRMTATEQARWNGVPDSVLAVAVAASLPGVSGVLVSPELAGRESWVRVLEGRPDVADVGRVLGA